MTEATRILSRLEEGDPSASEELLPLVYDELRSLAQARMAAERPDHTLQATALVHEAYLRLIAGEEDVSWETRGHFFAAAAEAMRRILVERARKQGKRDEIRGKAVPLDQLDLPSSFDPDELLTLDEAIEKLAAHEHAAAEIVKLRFFAGATMRQAAQVLNVPLRTAERHWAYARTWLHRELESSGG